MNRRSFLGAMAGGLAAANLSVPPLQGEQAPTPANVGPSSASPTSAMQGAWIRRGLIDAGGEHEPYIFLVRRGGESLDTRQFCDMQQSEETILKLHQQGIEVFHTHFYKGFGIEAERPFMEETKKAAAIAHSLGMKVDTYVQWDTMMFETFFAEEPQARNWIQIDAFGQPVMLEYGYQQSFRYRPCFSNQEYLDYLKKVVRLAVEEAKTDFIHFDNFSLNSEPYSCHCAQCVEGFRKRLDAKYTPEERRKRFGFADTSFVTPPLWNQANPPDKLKIIYDPGFEEWIDYRCQVMSSALAELGGYIRSLNPGVVVEVNCNGIDGSNHPWEDGVDWRRVLPHTQAFWAEAPTQPAYFPDGRLISTIRTYKMARAYDNVALTYIAKQENAMAECLAFNQTIGSAGQFPLRPEMVKYVAFYRKNRDLFMGSRDLASVAVFRSYPSITYNNARAQLAAILFEQSMIQSRTPFHLILDETIPGIEDGRFKVLVLPDSECLSDEQIAKIRKFVENGGGLVATGRSGLYDSWRRLRVQPGLRGLVEHQATGSAYEEEVSANTIAAGPPIRKQTGRGRVVYIPEIEFDGPLPKAEPFFEIGRRFWKRPKNWRDLVDAVTWASGGDPLLKASGPDFLIANLVEQPEKRRRIVHLVNYNPKASPTIDNIAIECALPAGAKAHSVTVYSPDLAAAKPLQFHMDESKAAFLVPSIRTYSFAVIEW